MVRTGTGEREGSRPEGEKPGYERPVIEDLGTLRGLTLGGASSVGADAWATATGGGS
jgi:hypothetical protein